MEVGEIEQGDLPDRPEAQQIFLRRTTRLGCGALHPAKGSRRRRDLQEVAAPQSHDTSILLSAVQLFLRSSVQVNLSVPLSSTRTKNDR